jgi:hypothetical protein
MYFSIHQLEHALAQFPNLLHFLDSWVVYKKEKTIPLIGLKHTPLSSWGWDWKKPTMNLIVFQNGEATLWTYTK